MRNASPKTIYAIRCRETSRIYIGCCANFESRIRAHFLDLEKGDKFRFVGPSDNRVKQDSIWQQDYKKYGRDSFDVYVMETSVPLEVADDKEREYILQYRSNEPEYGYNVRPVRKKYDLVIVPGRPPLPKISATCAN